MKIGFVSTYVMNNTQRRITAQAQSDLVKASYEATTGRVYDPGLALGAKSSRFLDTESQINYLNGLKDTNNLAALRMSASQGAISSLVHADKDGSAGVLNTFNKLLVGNDTIANAGELQSAAQSALDSFVSALNTSYNGEYVFGGTNTAEPPLDYYKAGSNEGGSRIVQQAFRDHFGFSPDDPAAADITKEEMEAFIDGPFSDLFEEPGWNASFSKADDTAKQNRISPSGETVDISVSANADGFRHAMRNLILVAEFDNIGLSKDAQAAVNERARIAADGKSTGGAITEIVTTSSELGNSEERVQRANERLDAQMTILNSTRNTLIGVDQTEASYRIMAIQNVLAVSYNLTAQISRLSLVNYLQ